jgi:LmbE family N-acetylglucosaminyl deacetylase
MIRKHCRAIILRLLKRRCAPLAQQALERHAVVFSPHFDDETLGVGGTILLKGQQGARVHLVFMTDGSRSHAHAMPGEELAALRRNEALNAAALLGVPADRVIFLNYPETELERHRDAAVTRVAALLGTLGCGQIFLPSTREPLLWSADHQATTDVVLRALEQRREPAEILEYPVWFWHHWPWVPIFGGNDAPRLFWRTVAGCFGVSALAHFNTAVPIESVRGEKRKALEAHASQVARLRLDVSWPVLGDVSGGEFVTHFFGYGEYFARRPFSPPGLSE